MDAIQTSDIKYIHSKECRKHYRNNWWEKYNGLAIKILIQTDNIKLFKVISKSIIRTTIMLQNIAEYSNEIMFNEYIKHIKYIPCRVETKDYFECHKYARDKPENFIIGRITEDIKSIIIFVKYIIVLKLITQ